jgi:uncharacterized delta-60 repeat protein
MGRASSEVPSEAIIQTDGKILVMGHFVYINEGKYLAFARYNPNGSLDTTYNAVGKMIIFLPENVRFFGGSLLMKRQDDNRIVVGAKVVGPTSGIGQSVLLRFNTNGSLDTTYATKGITTPVNLSVARIEVLKNGKTLMAGTATRSLPQDFALYCYNTNGSLDTTFLSNGKTITENIWSCTLMDMAVQKDDKIILYGRDLKFTEIDFVMARLNSSGAIDSSFGTNGIVLTPVISDLDLKTELAIAIQNNGKIVATGKTYDGTKFNFITFRYNNTVQTSLNTSSSEKENINIYPNPNNGQFNIDFQAFESQEISLKISDLAGKIVWYDTFDFNKQKPSKQIDLQFLNNGIYMVQVISKSKSATKLFAKY